MINIQKYVRAKSLEEAYTLNQKKKNRILAGMLWTRMESGNVPVAIDLCDLGLDKIEENEEEFWRFLWIIEINCTKTRGS